ncbi:MAG TPA: hypothetical protein VHY48_02800 [Acidobacteriaceae bacterium]|jgi:hypothetical protein|nr:hypothetical protein [Acidobacteriaceae bacterium]
MKDLSMVWFCCLFLGAALVFGGFGTSAALAQVGIYGMGSGGRFSAPGAQNGSVIAWGGTVGVYDNFVPLGPVKLGGDGRIFVQNSGSSTQYGNKLLGGLIGLRLALSAPMIPFRPYIQAEVGGVGTNNGDSASRTASVAYQVQGGLDVTVLPHLDLRGEYGAGQASSISNSGHTLEEFGAGVVLRL